MTWLIYTDAREEPYRVEDGHAWVAPTACHVKRVCRAEPGLPEVVLRVFWDNSVAEEAK